MTIVRVRYFSLCYFLFFYPPFPTIFRTQAANNILQHHLPAPNANRGRCPAHDFCLRRTAPAIYRQLTNHQRIEILLDFVTLKNRLGAYPTDGHDRMRDPVINRALANGIKFRDL